MWHDSEKLKWFKGLELDYQYVYTEVHDDLQGNMTDQAMEYLPTLSTPCLILIKFTIQKRQAGQKQLAPKIYFWI